jgi:hypothetical protein
MQHFLYHPGHHTPWSEIAVIHIRKPLRTPLGGCPWNFLHFPIGAINHQPNECIEKDRKDWPDKMTEQQSRRSELRSTTVGHTKRRTTLTILCD